MIACKKTRLTEAGNIVAGPAMLHWLLISNANDDNRHCTMNDASSGTDGEVMKFHIGGQRTEEFSFNPPMPFATGIRFSAFEHADMRVVGGYTD